MIRTNLIKARIGKTQQNSKCRLCDDRDETINPIISECSKLAQEYKTRHDRVGKVIHWEMCKKFKFDRTSKWYMLNPASVLENDTHTNSYGTLTYREITKSRRGTRTYDNQQQKKEELSTMLSRLTTE